PERWALDPEAGRFALPRQRTGPLAANVEDQEVLHRGRAQLAGAVALGQIGHGPHLLGGETTPQDRGAGVDVAVLLLRVNADVIAIHVVGRLFGDGGLESEADAPLELGLEALGGPAVLQEEELQPRLLAVLARQATIVILYLPGRL